MIVIEDAASPDSKGPAGALQLPLPATAPERSAPPPYARGLPEATPLQYPHDVHTPMHRSIPRGEPASPRFLKAFAAAVCVWLLLCILAGSFADVALSSTGTYLSFDGSNTRALLAKTRTVPVVL